MKILIVANHYAVCSARYAADAFTRLGHTVRHVGPAMGRSIWGMQVPEEYVWKPDPPNDMQWEDLTICMDSDPVMLDFAIQGNTPRIVWGVDNHVRDYRRPYFDHYFLAHKSVSVMDWGEYHAGDLVSRVNGVLTVVDSLLSHNTDMTWLPCAYDPIAFPPSPIPWTERKYDVCMIGVMYPKRWELVQAMRAAGLKVLAGTGLVYDAYRDAYHNSRVALVSSACGDLPIRLFEGAGMGCAVLCDHIQDLDDLEVHRDWHRHDPMSIYHDLDDVVTEARRLQTQSKLATQGIQWAENHTFDKRAQVIINWTEAR